MRLRSALILAVLALGACTEETVTYVERPPFNPPPDAAAGFLGYFTASTRQTTCGNCHSGMQASWVNTKHAHAWADLQASGHANSSCNACHTVSQLGNKVGKPAGYTVVPDTAFHDVQCESCHGPGHARGEPRHHREPAARLDPRRYRARQRVRHIGTHEPFVDQWVQSAHGSGPDLTLRPRTRAASLPRREVRDRDKVWGH
jgi:hypothetical protein